MNVEVETLYPRIGQRLRDLAGQPFERGFIRVEMADDFGSVGLFVDRGDGSYVYLTDDDGVLYDLFAELRRRSIAAGMGEWSQASVSLQADGRFSIDFEHDDISDLGQGPRRRDDWVRRMLGEPALVRWQTL